jgi:hypothetical protein
MLYLLSTRNHHRIAERSLGCSAHNGLAFVEKPLHAFARLRFRLLTEMAKRLIEPRNMPAGFLQVFPERRLETLGRRRLRQLWQSLGQLFLGIK